MALFLNRYELVGSLSSSTRNKVYQAIDIQTGKAVVIKLYQTHLFRHRDLAVKVFEREVSILNKIASPAIPELIDFGKTSSGDLYLITEYISGKTLKEIMQEGVDVFRFLEIILQLLSILDFVHNRGLIHRDIKPVNIIVNPEGNLYLLDFGIAKDLETRSDYTLTGEPLGSPEYVSPELANSEKTDFRTDLYSVAVMLYEYFAGKPPFTGKNSVHTLLLVMTANPPALDPKPELIEELEQVIFKGLAKKPQDRFSSAEDMLREIEQCYSLLKRGKRRNTQTTSTTKAGPSTNLRSAEDSTSKTVPDILCLDDQVFILNILRHILTSRGHNSTTCLTWDELHKYLQEGLPRLVITDVQMPEVNGVKVCQLLKSSFPDLKVVLFSNVPEEDLEQLAKEAKADGWISKSWTPDIWLKNIEAFLD